MNLPSFHFRKVVVKKTTGRFDQDTKNPFICYALALPNFLMLYALDNYVQKSFYIIASRYQSTDRFQKLVYVHCAADRWCGTGTSLSIIPFGLYIFWFIAAFIF